MPLQTAAHAARPSPAGSSAGIAAESPTVDRLCRPSRTPRCPSPSSGCCRSAPASQSASARPTSGQGLGRRPAGRCARTQRPSVGQRASCEKARDYSSVGVARSSAGLPKICAVPSRRGGLDHREATAGGSAIGVSRSPMPSTQALRAADEEGHVGAQRAGRAQPAARAASRRPHRRFSASRVVAASELPPPRPAPPGHALVDADVGAERAAAGLLQRARGAQAQVVGRQRRAEVVALQPAVGAALEVQRVAPVDQHEHRLQQVVAVGAPADDVQEQVELGRRRHVVERVSSVRSQPSSGRARHRRRRGSRRAATQPSA